MSEPTITYLGLACEADSVANVQPEVVAVIDEEGEHFKETVVTHRPGIDRLPVGTELVDRSHVTRLLAERDALQLRLNAADQRIDELTGPHHDDEQTLIAQHQWFIAGDFEELIDQASDFQDKAYALGLARGRFEAVQRQDEPREQMRETSPR